MGTGISRMRSTIIRDDCRSRSNRRLSGDLLKGAKIAYHPLFKGSQWCIGKNLAIIEFMTVLYTAISVLDFKAV